jgi:hypothetical protein
MLYKAIYYIQNPVCKHGLARSFPSALKLTVLGAAPIACLGSTAQVPTQA